MTTECVSKSNSIGVPLLQKPIRRVRTAQECQARRHKWTKLLKCERSCLYLRMSLVINKGRIVRGRAWQVCDPNSKPVSDVGQAYLITAGVPTVF